MSNPVLATTADPDGVEIVLDQEAWDHIRLGHPELAHLQVAIMTVPPHADHRRKDFNIECREWFYRNGIAGPTDWLGVVVDYSTTPARLITSYAISADPPGWLYEE